MPPISGSILRNGYELSVHDLDQGLVDSFVARGAARGESPKQLAETCDVVITCLPSPAACAAVVEGPGGVLEGIGPGKIWAEMSTTDAGETRRLAEAVFGVYGPRVTP